MDAPIVSAPPLPGAARWLALDTSTDRLSVAVGAAGATAPLAQHNGPGGSQASAALLPAIRALLDQAGWPLASLDGIAFGHGPGSFTGLRTACAVVQGLAVAGRPGGIPVLPLDTLLAVAEDARARHAAQATTLRVVAALDARMDEVYAGVYDWHAGSGWTTVVPPTLCTPEAVPNPERWDVAGLLAGNVAGPYGDRLPPAWRDTPAIDARPTAAALLRLATEAARATCVAAAHAQPLYVRDKVALTTVEQAALRAKRATGG